MRQKTIRRIDRFGGIILCAILTVLRRVASRVGRRVDREPPRRLLLLKPIEQGATVLACDARTVY